MTPHRIISTLEGLLPNSRNSNYVLTEDRSGTLTPAIDLVCSSLFLWGLSVSSSTVSSLAMLFAWT